MSSDGSTDAFGAWQTGKPWGDSARLIDPESNSLVAMPVVHAESYRSYIAHGYWLHVRKIDGEPRVSISFDRLHPQRVSQFASTTDASRPSAPPDDLAPKPGVANMRQVIVEEGMVEMSALLAAKLAATIIQQLALEAPDALASAGLVFAPNTSEPAEGKQG